MPTRAELGRVYADHRQGLFSLALSVTRDDAAAEDAVHDAFARLLREGHDAVEDMTAYAFRAVRNAAIDRRRRAEAFDKAVHRLAGSIFADSPLRTAMGAESGRHVRDAIDRLPDAQRETLVMRVYGGLTFDQIARTLDEPLGTVTTRYRRTLNTLREELSVLTDT